MSESRKLGFLPCVLLLIGAMIGSAIFSLSGLTVLLAGPAAMLSWLLAGVIMLFYGMFMAEMASRYPHSGGVYVFPQQAFGGKLGQYLGWISGWSAILTNIVAVAFGAIYVGQYLSVAFPWAANLQIPLAMLSILVCLVLNLIRIELTGKINAVIVLVLLGTILCYAISAFCGGTYDTALLSPFFTQGVNGGIGFLTAIPTAIVGFSGVIALAFMVSDVRDARKTIPLAICIAMGIVIAMYLFVIAATVGLVTADYLKSNPKECFIPLFSACFTKLQMFPWLTGIISIAAVLALMTTMLVCVTMNARAIQAASDDGILPKICGKVNRSGVPGIASAITCLCAMAYSCFPNLTMHIVQFGALFNLLTIVLTMLALLKARYDHPHSEGVFIVPGGWLLPVLLLIALILCNIMGVIAGGWTLWLYTVGFVLLGLAIMRFSRRKG